LKSRRGNAEGRQADEDDKKRQFAKGHESEGERGEEHRRRAVSMRQKHPDSGRNQQPRCCRGNPAKNVLKDRMIGVLEIQHTGRKTDYPGYQKEAGDGGGCPGSASQSCPDANRDADDVRAGHELAQAHDVGKFLLGNPPALIYRDAACPNKAAPAADPAERNLQERDKQSSQRNGRAGFPLFRRIRQS
jgi:hypothetical protein